MKMISGKDVWQDKQVLSQILYYGGIAILVLVLSLINFAKASFEFARLMDSSFWFQYIITIGSGFVAFLLMQQGLKLKFKSKEVITRLLEELTVYHNYIASTDGLWARFKEWLDNENSKTKLKLYVSILKKEKKKKAHTLLEEDKFDKLIEDAPNAIDKIDVECIEKTTNLIFAGIEEKIENAELLYKGSERMTEFILPAMAIGITFTALTLTFVITPAETGIEQIFQLVVRLSTILSYVLKGRDRKSVV